jgi:hypothetical protein
MAFLSKRDPQIVVVPVRSEPSSVAHHHSTTVHEHRAPTDASVALLKEMEAAAEKKIVETIRVGNTAIECVLHRWMDNLNDQMVVRATFKLNGITETAEHRWSPYSDTGEVHGYRALRDKIAEVIATKMIKDALSVRVP